MWILIDVYGNEVICNEPYEDLEEAKADLDAEFYCFTSDDNDIEYGIHCWQADDEMSAWARLNGKYRMWTIMEVTGGESMIRTILNKLNEKQLDTLRTYSALIERARANRLKEEFERNSGKLRGFLECLCQMQVITGTELKSLYLWFFEEDRSNKNTI